MTKYDLYIFNPFRNGQATDDGSIDLERFKNRGWAGLDESLEEARKILEKLRKYQVNGYLVESRYRQPRITLEEARKIAEKRYSELVESGRNLEPMDNGYDDIMWWIFPVEDIDAVAKGLIPGMVVIGVDKLDGHLRTHEEHNAWIKRSS